MQIFIEGLPRTLFVVWTDHAPLVPILEKQALADIANKRLQRLKMKVEHLTFKTVWIKGKDNVKADVLSRHPCAKADPEDELDEDINFVQGHLIELNVLHAQDCHIVDERLCHLRDFCNEDADYKMITEHVVKGYPKDAINIPDNLIPYYKARDHLYLDSDGFLCHKNTFVSPIGLRETYLKRLLAMHQAAPKMIARVRRSL
jgi:hypothetical protein